MISEKITVEGAAKLLLERDCFTVLSHANPDGDTAGCAFALCRALRKLGKKARVRCGEDFSARYGFMWENMEDEEFEEQTVVSVDVADAKLLGPIEKEYGEKILLAVDHHISHVDFSPYLLNEPDAAACAQTIFKIIREMNVPLDRDIAACLYTAIVTDSGCFKFSSVTPETHRIAAELLEYGFDFASLNYMLFDMKTRARLSLEQTIYREMEFFFEGRCAVTILPKSQLDGVDPEDANGISAIPRQIEGVEVGVVLKEKKKGWKASLRSNNVDVQKICGIFGGGGHTRAAGCSFPDCTAEEAKKKLLAEIEKVLP